MSGLWSFLANAGKLLIWWIVIQPWEQAIRVRGGKRMATLPPGISLKIPYLDVVHVQTVRLRISMIPMQTVTTSDGKTVTLAATFGYRIADISLLYNTLHHPEDTIRNVVQGNVAEYVQTHPLLECSPETIATCVSDKIDLAKYGLDADKVNIVDYAVVKTYRFLQAESHYSSGDHLSTDQRDGPS